MDVSNDTFVKGTIAKKETFGGLKLKLMIIIRFKKRKTSTTKYFEELIIKFLVKKLFKVNKGEFERGNLLMRKVAETKTSHQNLRSIDIWAKRVRPISTMCLCFLSAMPCC